MSFAHSKTTDVLIGLNIKFARKQKHKTQKEIAKMLDMTFQQFQKYETGKSRLTVALLLKLSDILDVSVYELINVEYMEQTLSLQEKKVSFMLSKQEVEVLKYFHAIDDDKIRIGIVHMIKSIGTKNNKDEI